MEPNAKIYIAGHRGLVGSALLRRLRDGGYANIATRTHAELELCDQAAVNRFFRKERPEYVFLAAAKVGGIHANSTYPADFAYSNMQIQCNIVHASWQNKVKKLLFLGSSCIYPKHAEQPIKEESLLAGPLEPTNQAYAVAKIAGIIMCQSYRAQHGADYICVMPTNLYGLHDNYHPENSHVLPGLLRRIHEAKSRGEPTATIWGSGEAKREFLYADDLADACVFLMEHYDGAEIINIGSGDEVTIKQLATLISEVVGFTGKLVFDRSRPDGTPRKLVDSSRLKALGWRPSTTLRDGIELAYRDFLTRSPVKA